MHDSTSTHTISLIPSFYILLTCLISVTFLVLMRLGNRNPLKTCKQRMVLGRDFFCYYLCLSLSAFNTLIKKYSNYVGASPVLHTATYLNNMSQTHTWLQNVNSGSKQGATNNNKRWEIILFDLTQYPFGFCSSVFFESEQVLRKTAELLACCTFIDSTRTNLWSEQCYPNLLCLYNL